MYANHIAKLVSEWKHARTQYRRAANREQLSAFDMDNCVLPSVAVVRRHALDLASEQKWLGAMVRARRSLRLFDAEHMIGEN